MNKCFRLSLFLFALLWLSLYSSCGDNSSPKVAPPSTQNPAQTGNIAEWSDKIANAPDNAQLYIGRAQAYLELDGYDEAISDFSKAITIDSTQAEYHHLLADAYLDYFKSNQALKVMENASQLFPERIPTLLKTAEFQLILKKHNRSLISVDRVLKLDPLNAEAFFMSGRIFEDQQQDEKAIRSYQKAVEYDPDLVEVWVKLGFMLEKKNDPEALRYFDNAILVDSLNVAAHFARASHLHEKGQLDQAINAYKIIHRLEPQYANAYYNCGLIYMEMDSIQQGKQQFDLAVKMKPTHIMAYFYRGVAGEMSGDIEGAKRDYQQALNLNPSFERAQAALDQLNTSE